MKYLFSILLMFSFLAFPFFSQAATASLFTLTDVSAATFAIVDNNKLIMDIALPDAAADTAVECDGTETTSGSGACESITAGNAFLAVSAGITGGGLLCTNSLTAPTIIFKHATSCTTDGTASGVTNYRGAAAISTAYTNATASGSGWGFRDTQTVNGTLDLTASAATSEDIYYDADKSLLYNADKLASITVSNAGTATDADFSAIKIYQESGTAGFDYSADTLIGSKTSSPFLGTDITTGSSTFYVNGASATASNRRIYIAADISSPNNNVTIQARIATGATTIAMSQTASINNGPTDAALTNTSVQTIVRKASGDFIAPTSSITSLATGATLEMGKDYTISGSSSDTGGSSIQKVEISFDNGINWFLVTPKTATASGFNWEYIWINPGAGAYTIKYMATDWFGNREIPSSGITIKVEAISVAPEEQPLTPAPEHPVPEQPTTEQPASEITPAAVQLIRADGDHKVYVLKNGFKRHIINLEAFNAGGYKWSDVQVVAAASRDQYPDVVLIRAEGDTKVYRIEDSKRIWIKTAEEFEAGGYKWNEISDIPLSELNVYPEGEAVVGATIKVVTGISSLNVRTEGSLSGKIIGKLYPGDVVSLLGESNGWYNIKLPDGTIGWISAKYAVK